MKSDANPQSIKLTQFAKSAGCAAKIGPEELSKTLKGLPKTNDPALLVGNETADDAAVYKLTDDIAIVQTLDFFPPVVDDPYTFGQIAAANALSDVYAMGGEPLTALNIVAFPNCLGTPTLSQILKGGANKVIEAGASIAGGHSINDEEPKYGLSVTGIIHPKKIRKNTGALPGDILILTKPIGTGIINTAVKAQMADEKSRKDAETTMITLNRAAKRVFDTYSIHACTDITGFSLAGHSREMADASEVSIEIDFSKIPLLYKAKTYANQGLIPAGTYRNQDFMKDSVCFDCENELVEAIVFDPQTSGGLLVSVNEADATSLLEDLSNFEGTGIGTPFSIIGQVKEKQDKSVYIINCRGQK